MDLSQLHYFAAIAKWENMSKAAEELHIPQPSLSMSLKRLEEQLGVPLFDRRRGRLELNAYGRIAIDHVQSIIQEYEHMEKELAETKESKENSIKVGIADWGFPLSAFARFIHAHPEIQVNSMLLSGMHYRDFYDFQCDFVIAPLPSDYKNSVCTVLREEQVFLTCAKGHRLAGKWSVSLAELSGERLLVSGSNSHFGDFIRGMFEEAGVEPKSWEACTAGYLRELLTTADFVALTVPGMLSYMGGEAGLVNIPLNPPVFRKSGMFHGNRRPLDGKKEQFYQFIQDYFLCG